MIWRRGEEGPLPSEAARQRVCSSIHDLKISRQTAHHQHHHRVQRPTLKVSEAGKDAAMRRFLLKASLLPKCKGSWQTKSGLEPTMMTRPSRPHATDCRVYTRWTQIGEMRDNVQRKRRKSQDGPSWSGFICSNQGASIGINLPPNAWYATSFHQPPFDHNATDRIYPACSLA